MIKVDVVIPVFNGAKFVSRALESLMNQNYAPNKIIVVDDGSSDHSLQVIETYLLKMPNLVVVPEFHRGLSATRNKGITASTAAFIAFLDCDDYWAPAKLENQVKHLESHPNCDAVFSNCYINDENTRSVYGAAINAPYAFSLSNILTQRYRVLGSASSICVRRDVFQVAGMFDESKLYGEDYDLWVRISESHQICEVQNRDVFITKRQDSMQSIKAAGLARFKNSIVYLDVWKNYQDSLFLEKREFEKLIFPDIAKSIFTAPRELIDFYRFSKQNYPRTCAVIFPNRFTIISFLVRNSVRSFLVSLQKLFKENSI